jgi:hypothetical protein
MTMRKKTRKIQLSRETLVYLSGYGTTAGLKAEEIGSRSFCAPDCIDINSVDMAINEGICPQSPY